MKKKSIFLLITGCLVATAATASTPYKVVYTDSISSTNISGLTSGNQVWITMILNNGNDSANSQTWTTADLCSVTFRVNTWSMTIDYTSGEALSSTTGSFATDASGNLTAVPSAWCDSSVSNSHITYTTALTDMGWSLNGTSTLLTFTDTGYNDYSLALSSASCETQKFCWDAPVAIESVPEAADFGFAAGVGVLGLVFLRRKKA